MKYKSNRNIVFSCNYHVVFCPKYRRPVLVDGVDERFKEIAWEVADELGFEIAEMEVMPDHVHLLLSIDPQLSIHRAIKRIKGRSSHDLREEFPWLKSRIPTLWTNSYFVSTVGLPRVRCAPRPRRQRGEKHTDGRETHPLQHARYRGARGNRGGYNRLNARGEDVRP